MGPSTSVDGEEHALHLLATCVEASMGPSTSVDGEQRPPTEAVGSSSLQWGRRQASTERLISAAA